MNTHNLEKIPVHQPPDALYEAHEKLYPREIMGPYQQVRKLCIGMVLLLFYGLAWIPWEGRQAVLFDLPARQFSIFGLQFWPQDFYLLSWLLIISALTLFTATALAGRVWCGYACPQTVWTELFLWIERVTEGTFNRRKKLDAQPWNKEKLLKKSVKQGLWVFIALWTGFTFVGYFTPIKTLAEGVIQLQLGGWEWFWILFYGFATYGNARFMREQVCKYMCPYARFQSAMLDQRSLVISYDSARGEPRKQKSLKADELGDCIDCKICVQVCPTGIDIRQGLQYECIGCAACIDACNQVMEKIGKRPGLIRYCSEQELSEKPLEANQDHLTIIQSLVRAVLRPRMMLYLTLLALLSVSFVATIALRSPAAIDVLRDRRAFYQQTMPGFIDNIYNIKILNKSKATQHFKFAVTEHPEAELFYSPKPLIVEPFSDFDLSLRIRLPEGSSDGSVNNGPVNIELMAIEQNSQFVAKSKTLFWYPKEQK